MPVEIAKFLIGFCLPIAAFADGNFGQFSAILREKSEAATGPYKIAEALSDLKKTETFAPLFAHYTLGKDSFSLQPSTPVEPRAILFGNTAKLIVTFNSGPHMLGGASLETAEFDETDRKIYFREIIFKDESPSEELDPEDIEFENDKIGITRANPEKCMQCHSVPSQPYLARYVWNSYPGWPRFYGAESDELDELEIKQLAEFKSKPHNRYSQLSSPSETYPYLYRETITLVARPNLFLTKAIGVYQSIEIADLILSKMTSKNRLEFQKSLLRHYPERESMVDRSLKDLKIDPHRILLIPPDENTVAGYNLGTASLFGGYGVNSMIEFQLFKLIYGEKVISYLLANLPYRPGDKTLYPKIPDSYYASLNEETSRFANANIRFKSVWWEIKSQVRRKALAEAVAHAR